MPRLKMNIYRLRNLKVTSMGTIKNVVTRCAVTVSVCLVTVSSAFAAHFEKIARKIDRFFASS